MGERFDEKAVVCFRWETYWPHALLDPWAVPTTTDRRAVTCAACAHALGSQKYEPPTPTKTNGEPVDLLAALQRSLDAAKQQRLRPGKTGGDDA